MLGLESADESEVFDAGFAEVFYAHLGGWGGVDVGRVGLDEEVGQGGGVTIFGFYLLQRKRLGKLLAIQSHLLHVFLFLYGPLIHYLFFIL